MSTMTFTQEALQRVSSALQSYYKDKHNTDISQAVGHDVFRMILMQAVKTVTAATPNAALDVLSRGVLQEARSLLTRLGPVKPQFEQVEPQQVIAQQQQQYQTQEPMFDLQQQQQATDPDQDFNDRLQSLETQRRVVGQAVLPQVNATTSAVVVAGPTAPAPNYSAQAFTPIVIPAHEKRGRILPISSLSRAFVYQPERAMFTWPGPLPPMKDASHVAVAAVQTPAFVASLTPYITVRIIGVGEAMSQCVLLPSNTGATWATWMPCSPATRFIRPVPTPWTLELLDARGDRLALGEDNKTGRVNMQNQRIELSDDAWTAFSLGDLVYVESGARSQRARVTGQKEMVLSKTFQGQIASSEDVPLMNETRQWTLFLELEGN